jgi:glycosyltransferase involved in cell wall biosynthesis
VKIAFHITGNEGGGVAMVNRHLANELKTFGHEICFLSDKDGKFSEEARGLGEVRITDIPSINNTAWHLGPVRLPGILNLWHNWKTIHATQKKLVGILRKLQPDIVIGYGTASGALYGKPCRQTEKRLLICLHGVGSSHNDLFSIRARIASKYLNRADLLVGVSDAANKRYEPFLRIPFETIYNCPKPVLLDQAFADSFRQDNDIPFDAMVIGGAGRMVCSKGHHVLIDAMKRLHDKGIDLYCVLAGSGAGNGEQQDYYNALLSRIKHYGLEKRIFMPGFMPMERFLAIIDIFCHTYIGQEGLGLTILEAMQAGKPVIATTSGGPQEIIRSEEEGILISYDSSELLGAAVETLLEEPQRRATMRERGKKRIEETFNYSKWGLKWDAVLKSVVSRTEQKGRL